jgi:hypothetical protein
MRLIPAQTTLSSFTAGMDISNDELTGTLHDHGRCPHAGPRYGIASRHDPQNVRSRARPQR